VTYCGYLEGGCEQMTVKRNPNWTQDELILALDLYVRSEGQSQSWIERESAIVSKQLGQLNIHDSAKINDMFRSPEGVWRRSRYFERLDRGEGIDGREEYIAVWKRYRNDALKLADAAAKIVERRSKGNKSNVAVKTKRKDEHLRFESFVVGKQYTRPNIAKLGEVAPLVTSRD